jgi:hypothetical protein
MHGIRINSNILEDPSSKVQPDSIQVQKLWNNKLPPERYLHGMRQEDRI